MATLSALYPTLLTATIRQSMHYREVPMSYQEQHLW